MCGSAARREHAGESSVDGPLHTKDSPTPRPSTLSSNELSDALELTRPPDGLTCSAIRSLPKCSAMERPCPRSPRYCAISPKGARPSTPKLTWPHCARLRILGPGVWHERIEKIPPRLSGSAA